MSRKLPAAAAIMLALAMTTPAQAQAAATADSGDVAWILVSSALVLMMAMPGLTLFYGGLVRAKSFLAVLVQVGAIAAVASILWIVVGYTMAFGNVGIGWIGDGNAMMLTGNGDLREGLTLPEPVFALFQMCFALITPALMAGAWVDRARFGWVVAFCALWGLVVYAPVAHWIWGGGWMASGFGTLDFAGGIVVHTTAGVSALAIAILIGKRAGFPKTPLLPHSPALTMAGAALLWVGWFGFNGGSALAANGSAALAIINTHLAASAAALLWIALENRLVGKPTSVGFATGAIAGLATVTPAAGFIGPGAAITFGLVGTSICYAAIQLVKQKWQVDDSLDVFAVHGVGGMTGSLMLAVFMADALGGAGYAPAMDMGRQFLAQVVGVGVVAVWSVAATVILAKLVALIWPMRVDQEAETIGLDITSHGERAWEFD